MTFSTGPWLLTFMVLATFFFVNAFAIRIEKKMTQIELEKICSATQNKALCMRVLSSDPRTATADILALSGISIDTALSSVKSTASLLAKLVIDSGTVGSRERYLECSKFYGLASRDLTMAKTAFANKDLDGVEIRTRDVTDELKNCRDAFEVPPAEPQLQSMINDDVDLAFIAFVIGVLVTV